VAMAVGFLSCFGLRLVAIRRGWRLPTAPPASGAHTGGPDARDEQRHRPDG
jgi:hypothetical protein